MPTTLLDKLFHLPANVRGYLHTCLDDLKAHSRAHAVSKRVRKGQERVYSAQEIMAEIGLAR